MRITLVGPTAPLRGGIVAHTEGARAALDRRSHRVDVRGFSRLYPRWIGGDRPGSGRDVQRVAGSIDALAPTSWRKTAAEIRTDLLLVEYWTPLLAPALRSILARSTARRRILVCHNVRPHEPVGGARLLLDSLLRRVDGVIVHSETVLGSLHAPARCDFATMVAPMPLLSSGRGEARCLPEIPREVVAADDLVVLVGHLRRYKGLDVLERAWRAIQQERPQARLVVAGEPVGVRRDLAGLARIGTSVTVVPRYLDDAELRWLLANARSVVLPYTSASQSGVLPLALRLARHVIVSDAGGLGEQLVGGIAPVSQVPAGDVAALVRAIEEALRGDPDTPASALRQATAELAADEVAASWQPFVAAVEALAARSMPGLGHSNRREAEPSVDAETTGDEAPRQAWYDAEPSAASGAEIQRT